MEENRIIRLRDSEIWTLNPKIPQQVRNEFLLAFILQNLEPVRSTTNTWRTLKTFLIWYHSQTSDPRKKCCKSFSGSYYDQRDIYRKEPAEETWNRYPPKNPSIKTPYKTLNPKCKKQKKLISQAYNHQWKPKLTFQRSKAQIAEAYQVSDDH